MHIFYSYHPNIDYTKYLYKEFIYCFANHINLKKFKNFKHIKNARFMCWLTNDFQFKINFEE